MPGGSPRRAPLLLAGALVFGLLAFASAPVVVSALETHGVGLAARTQSSGPHAASAGRLRITATLTDVGYVGVTIAGPSGAKVQLGEALPSGTKPIQIVRLGSQGARVPKALRWSCDERKRNLVATTLPPAAPQDAKVSVMTPGCSQRLVATISKQALVGRTASISLHDRWGIGDLPLRICITPPGGTPACKQSSLRSDQSRQVVRFTAPRPGGWRVDVSTRFGDHTRATVWVSHPGGRIRLLATGDSEMLVLDSYLATDLASHGVDVTSDARSGTALTVTYAFNWETHARHEASAVRPDVTVMFIGANDSYEVSGPHGRPIYCCGSAWSAGYAKLVAKMMRSYLRGNAGRVYWFLLPTPRPRDFQYLFDGVNSGIRQAAKQFPGRVALIDANAFFTPHNHYRNQMTDHGYGFTIHEPDGIHLTTISDIFAADLVVKQLLADRVIR
jgi:lysophospholipase L1-like esterase